MTSVEIIMTADTTYTTHHELVRECQRGSQSAFEQIYTLYGGAMYAVAHRIMGDREEARDMMQEGFYRAYDRIAQFRFDASFGAWLKRIIIRQCLDEQRRRRIDYVGLEDEHMHHMDTASDDQEPTYTVDLVRAAHAKLSDGYRTILSLYIYEGYTHREIAEILGISEQTSKSQYHRAKKQLKSIMQKSHG